MALATLTSDVVDPLSMGNAGPRTQTRGREQLPKAWEPIMSNGKRVFDALPKGIQKAYHSPKNAPTVYFLDDNLTYAENRAADLCDVYPGAEVKCQSNVDLAVDEMVGRAKKSRSSEARHFDLLILDVFHGEDKIQGFQFLKNLHERFRGEGLLDMFPSTVVSTASLMSPEVFHTSSRMDAHLSEGLSKLDQIGDIASLSADTQQLAAKGSQIHDPPILFHSKTNGGDTENLAELALMMDMARYRMATAGGDGGTGAVDFLRSFTPRLFKKSPAAITTHMVVERARDVARGVRKCLTDLGLGQKEPHPFFQSRWWQRNQKTLMPSVERLEKINFSDVLDTDSAELTSLRLHGVVNDMLNLTGPDLNQPRDSISQFVDNPTFMEIHDRWEKAVKPIGATNRLYRAFESNLVKEIDLVNLVGDQSSGGVTLIRPHKGIMLPAGNLPIADAVVSAIDLSKNRLGPKDRLSLEIKHVAISSLDEGLKNQLGDAGSCAMIEIKDSVPSEGGTENGDIDLGAKLVRMRDKVAFRMEKGEEGHKLTLYITGVRSDVPPAAVEQSPHSIAKTQKIALADSTFRYDRNDYAVREGLGPLANTTLLGKHPLEITENVAGCMYQHEGKWVLSSVPDAPHRGPSDLIAKYLYEKEASGSIKREFKIRGDVYKHMIRLNIKGGKVVVNMKGSDERAQQVSSIFKDFGGSDYIVEFGGKFMPKSL